MLVAHVRGETLHIGELPVAYIARLCVVVLRRQWLFFLDFVVIALAKRFESVRMEDRQINSQSHIVLALHMLLICLLVGEDEMHALDGLAVCTEV